MRKLFTIFLMLTALTSFSQGDLILTAIFDADLPGGLPKGVEIYAANDISDLSEYGLGSANNGGGSDGEEFTFPAVAVTSGSYIYVTTDSAEFNQFYGFDADYIDGSMAINGDDAVELFHNGSVADVYGDINTDGSGESWEYKDSWAYRLSSTGPDGSTWTESNWTIAGVGTLDGELTNATAVTPVPVGTYLPSVSTNFDLTFQVDMSNVGPIADTVSVAGNFQVAAGYASDWAPGETILDDPDNDSVYTLTVSVPAGTYEYKFVNGTSWGLDEIVPGGCAVNDNRQVIIAANTTLDVVCFGSCVSCSNQVHLSISADLSNETVDPLGVFVAGNFQGWSSSSTPMVAMGNGIFTYEAMVDPNSTVEYKFINGTNWENVSGACTQNSNRYVNVGTNDTSVGAFVFGSCDVTSLTPDFIDINTLRLDAPDGTPLFPDTSGWIKGIVTSIDFDGNNGISFYIDDNGAGMSIFNFNDVSGYKVQMGDEVYVQGSMDFYNGLSQWFADSIVVASTGNTLPNPTVTSTLDESTESQLIRMNDVTLADPGQWPTPGNSANVDIITSANDTMTMRIYEETDIEENVSPPSGMFDVVGIGGQFDGSAPHDEGYQIFPRMQSDIITGPAMTFIDINTIRQDAADGTPLYPDTSGWIKGVVTSIDFDGNNGISFFIDDNGAGMNIFNFNDVSGYQVQMGDEVYVQGSMDFFNGLSEWFADSIVVASTGNALPNPSIETMLDESTESQLIRMNDVTLADPGQWPTPGNSSNVDIITTANDTFTMRIYEETDIEENVSPPSGMFDVIGLGSQFDGSAPHDEGYQILPRMQSDIITGPAMTFIDINTIRQDAADGTPLYPDTSGWIKGVVTSIDFDGNNGISFFIDDNGAGMNIFNFNDVSGYQVQMGDEVYVQGSMDFFNGLSEWFADSIVVASTGNALPNPSVETMLDESTESQLIRMNDVTLADPGQWPTPGNSSNVDIITTANDTFTMRIYEETDIEENVSPPVTAFDVIGLGSQFDGSAPHDEGYQILPRMQSDIIVLANDTPSVFFSQVNITVNESDGTADLNISITDPNNDTTKVDVVLTGGSATAGSDFNFSSPVTVVFPPKSTASQTVTVDIIDDADQEGNETITFQLQNPTNDARILIANTTVTIEANDKPLPVYNIDEINGVNVDGEGDSVDVRCELRGIVTTINFNSDLQFWIQDPTGGINVFSFDPLPSYPTVTMGDSIHVIGRIAEFNGLLEIFPDSIALISQGNDLPEPMEVDTLIEAYESELLVLNDVEITDSIPTGGGYNMEAVHDNDTIIIRIDNATDVYNMTMPMGFYRITGVGSQFDGSSPYTEGYQLQVRGIDDFEQMLAPTADFDFTVDTFSVMFEDQSANHPSSWSWDFGDGNTSNEQNPTHIYASGGSYEVCLTVTNSQGNNQFCDSVTTTVVGLARIENDYDLNIFPVPTSNNLSIDADVVIDQIELMDVSGRNVISETVNDYRTTITLGNLSQGVYLIRIFTSQGTLTRKIIKE